MKCFGGERTTDRYPPARRPASWAVSLAEARHRLRELEGEKAAVIQAMEAMVQQFSRTFSPPWPAHPVVQRLAQGRVYLRWRLSGRQGNQSYLNLAGEGGQAWLQALSGEVRQVFTHFARDAVCLNLAHSLRQGEWLRLRQFLAESEVLLGATARRGDEHTHAL